MSTKINIAIINLMLATLCGCTANLSSTHPAKPMTQLEMDQKMVAMGLLPPVVLKIDAELEKVSADSPQAIQLRKQKLALIQQQNQKLQAEERSYRSTQAPAQPQAEEQRMCSINNGSAIYLAPC